MQKSPLALLPLGLFLLLFIGSGLYFQSVGADMAFYQISAPVAILPAIAIAMALDTGPLNDRIQRFISGVGDNTIITMVLIYLLAGAFASVAKAIGGVDATVNLGLSLIPSAFILPGLFLITAFVATSMGTSMGTIAAIGPVAAGLTQATDLSLPVTMGTVIGGAMFGDNLSIISDTTIAATRTQGCNMKDKFRMNFLIALPAALATLAFLFFQSRATTVNPPGDFTLLQILPYLVVLFMAMTGLHVLAVLCIGILLAGTVGLATQGYTLTQLSHDIYAGYSGMQEILILSLLIGGLGALMKHQGGIDWISERLSKLSQRKKSSSADNRRTGEISISLLAALTNLCTANNTVAILLSGSLARNIASTFGVSARRSASLIDIFACIVQGLIPYGAQTLLAGSIAHISPLVLTGHIHYCWLLALFALLSVMLNFPAGGENASAEKAVAGKEKKKAA